jgi:hypothetical protein
MGRSGGKCFYVSYMRTDRDWGGPWRSSRQQGLAACARRTAPSELMCLRRARGRLFRLRVFFTRT